MTAAAIERLARLLHAEAVAAIDADPEALRYYDFDEPHGWDDLPAYKQRLYRRVARAALKRLGR